MYQEYIERDIIRETEKAYLVIQPVNNRRDGTKVKYRWVAKSKCRPLSEESQKKYDAIPDGYKKYVHRRINVPEWLVGQAEW